MTTVYALLTHYKKIDDQVKVFDSYGKAKQAALEFVYMYFSKSELENIWQKEDGTTWGQNNSESYSFDIIKTELL